MNAMHLLLVVAFGLYLLSYSIDGWARKLGPLFGVLLFIVFALAAYDYYVP